MNQGIAADDDYIDNRMCEVKEDEGYTGRVFAVRAVTGTVLWSTPFRGEVKGAIAGGWCT